MHWASLREYLRCLIIVVICSAFTPYVYLHVRVSVHTYVFCMRIRVRVRANYVYVIDRVWFSSHTHIGAWMVSTNWCLNSYNSRSYITNLSLYYRWCITVDYLIRYFLEFNIIDSWISCWLFIELFSLSFSCQRLTSEIISCLYSIFLMWFIVSCALYFDALFINS